MSNGKKADKTEMENVDKEFKNKSIDRNLLKNCPVFDINAMYQRVFEELGLQQSKRDQLITIYLAAFAFVVPSLLSRENVNWIIAGSIFMILGIIGLLFALIIIRYRKYKEVYWISCRTLNVMMDLDNAQWTKENIQAIFYECLYKKIKDYIVDKKPKKKSKKAIDGRSEKQPEKAFKTFNYVMDNLFSSETLYLIIHLIIASCVFGFGLGMVLPLSLPWKITLGLISGLILFIYCAFMYFRALIKVFKVCVDGLNKSFNSTYRDAWFLHFFI